MKKEKGYSCFSWTRLSDSPLTLLHLFKRNIQFAYQRIRYGYCERDVWNLDRWFLHVVPAMLDDLRENTLDVPTRLISHENGTKKLIPEKKEMESAAEKWDDILKQMAFFIREADEDNCSRKNPYEKQYWMIYKKYGIFGEALKTSEETEKEKQTGEIYMHLPSEIPEYKEMIIEKYLDEEKKIWLYRDRCKNKGIQMFQEWFWDLWW